MPDYYDPFSTRDPNKIQDRVQPGRANFWENPPEADVSRNAPNIGAPILPPNLTPGPRYTPIDFDPFQRAAERVQRSVRPPGGRTEGMLTSLPEDVLIPKTPLDVAVMAAGGPMGRLAKLATVAGGAALTSSDAEAGPINRVISAGGSAIERLVNGIRAYHGSPHDFDKFDLSKIGTGEGAQSYGHGLYFAESEGVARSYRDRLQSTQSTFQQAPISTRQSPRQLVETNVRNDIAGQLRYADDPENAMSIVRKDYEIRLKTGRDLQKYIDTASGAKVDPHISEWLKNAPPREVERQMAVARSWASSVPDLESRLSVIDKFNPADFGIKKSGKMYEVNINAKPEQFLDWDKPVRDQPVNELIERAGIPTLSAKHKVPLTGSGVYDAAKIEEAVKYQNRKQWDISAADRLREAGIPGIKYLDQGSRYQPNSIVPLATGRFAVADSSIGRLASAGSFATREEAQAYIDAMPKTTNNYVLFDDKIVDIIKKYGIGGMSMLPPATAAFLSNKIKQVDFDPFDGARN